MPLTRTNCPSALALHTPCAQGANTCTHSQCQCFASIMQRLWRRIPTLVRRSMLLCLFAIAKKPCVCVCIATCGSEPACVDCFLHHMTKAVCVFCVTLSRVPSYDQCGAACGKLVPVGSPLLTCSVLYVTVSSRYSRKRPLETMNFGVSGPSTLILSPCTG